MRTATPPNGLAKPGAKRAGARRSRVLTTPISHPMVVNGSRIRGLIMKKLILALAMLPGVALAGEKATREEMLEVISNTTGQITCRGALFILSGKQELKPEVTAIVTGMISGAAAVHDDMPFDLAVQYVDTMVLVDCATDPAKPFIKALAGIPRKGE